MKRLALVMRLFTFAAMVISNATATANTTLAENVSSPSTEYVRGLREKYAGRLHYQTDHARQVVQGFNIGCKSADGRYLPLENVLLAKLAEIDTKKVWLTTRVDSKGEDVRIYDELFSPTGMMESKLIFDINKWGELHAHGIRLEAVLNSCHGGYGPIWVGARAVPAEAAGSDTERHTPPRNKPVNLRERFAASRGTRPSD